MGPFPSLLVSTTVARPVYSGSVLNWIVTEEMVEQLAKNINTATVFLDGVWKVQIDGRKLGSPKRTT